MWKSNFVRKMGAIANSALTRPADELAEGPFDDFRTIQKRRSEVEIRIGTVQHLLEFHRHNVDFIYTTSTSSFPSCNGKLSIHYKSISSLVCRAHSLITPLLDLWI